MISFGCFIYFLDWVYGSCEVGTWTNWMNRDNPADGLDDETTFKYINLDGINLCDGNAPTSTEARVAGTEADYKTTGQTVSIDPVDGFKCEDSNQNGQSCENYEVRFCCP